MANWCSNTVEFRGESEQLVKLKKLLFGLFEKAKAEDKGQLPDFIKSDDGYFFEMDLSLFPMIHYETRWVPNTDIIRQIADHFAVSFVHEYIEAMNGVRGEAHYFGGLLLTMDD